MMPWTTALILCIVVLERTTITGSSTTDSTTVSTTTVSSSPNSSTNGSSSPDTSTTDASTSGSSSNDSSSAGSSSGISAATDTTTTSTATSNLTTNSSATTSSATDTPTTDPSATSPAANETGNATTDSSAASSSATYTSTTDPSATSPAANETSNSTTDSSAASSSATDTPTTDSSATGPAANETLTTDSSANGTSDSDLTSAAEVTSPVATTTPTTTPKYTTKPPNVPGTAVFVFSFTILVPASVNFTELWESELETEFVVAFNDTQGFREIAVLEPANSARKKRAADTQYEFQAKYGIDEVQKANTTVLVSSLEDALSQVNQSANHKNLTLATYDEPVAFAEKLLDVCKAADVTCDWGYKCVANRCLFKCEGFDCGDHLCHVPQTGQEDEKDEPQCKCVPDDMYNYDGEKCDEASLREKWVVVIAGSVGGFLLLVVVVLVACFCCHRRRLKQQDKPYLDAYEPSELNGYNDTQIAKKFRTSYDNEAYQADGLFPTPRGDVDLHRFYDSSPPDNGLPSEPTPMLSDFAEGPFVIRRPKLLVRPKTEM